MALKVRIVSYQSSRLTGEISVSWHLFDDASPSTGLLEGVATATVGPASAPATVVAALRAQVIDAAKVARQTGLVEQQLAAAVGVGIDLT